VANYFIIWKLIFHCRSRFYLEDDELSFLDAFLEFWGRVSRLEVKSSLLGQVLVVGRMIPLGWEKYYLVGLSSFGVVHV